MKVKRRVLCLGLILIAVWLFLFIFVFPSGSRGSENETFLPLGTAAVVYYEGTACFIQSPNPEDVSRALMENEPSWWIGTGKWIAGGSAAAATFFYGVSIAIPPTDPVLGISKVGAEALSVIFSGIAAGVGVSVVWVDSKRPKLTWEEAKFYFLSPEEKPRVLKFPDGKIAVVKKEAKLERYLLVDKFLVILKQETNLPPRTLLNGKILYFKEKPLLPSRELKKNGTLKIDIDDEIKTLVIY